MEYIINIKGMLCGRCILALESTLRPMHLQNLKVTLGQVSFTTANSGNQLAIEEAIGVLGFEILADKNHQLITLLDQLIDEYLSNSGLIDKGSKFSTYLSETLN